MKIFTDDFLHRFRRLDDPPSAFEAALAGPWEVEEAAGGFMVMTAGGRAAARCEERVTAHLMAACLPGLGRRDLFSIVDGRAGPELRRAGETLAWLSPNARDLAPALHVGDCLLRSPQALAHLLEAAGSTALEGAGSVLARRLGIGCG
ncbi:MAG: hypothetical protein AAF604_19355 [Acidobacteriota bacterium]